MHRSFATQRALAQVDNFLGWVRTSRADIANRKCQRILLVLKSDDASRTLSPRRVTGNYSVPIFDAMNFLLPDGTNLVTMQSILGRFHW
jgi:hypothetical protein